jgi:hypothetical protein
MTPTDIEEADAGILKALLGLGCAALIIVGGIVATVMTVIRVWKR